MKIGFIGGGNMAGALIGGLTAKSVVPEQIHVVDVNADALRDYSRAGMSTAQSITHHLAACDVIVLAVKPQQMKQVAGELAAHLRSQLVISIAAGIRAADLFGWLKSHSAIVRAMPNTPALIGRGITGLVALPGVTVSQKQAADTVLSAVGETVWLDDESKIDAVTAVSGSGPAYVFYFIEAMQNAAEALGLPAAQARQLALSTFGGASQLAIQSNDSVAILRERVTSQGGTTYAALQSMEQNGVSKAIAEAMNAAARRSREIGEEFGRA